MLTRKGNGMDIGLPVRSYCLHWVENNNSSPDGSESGAKKKCVTYIFMAR
jgi:hypothetical protein